MFKKIFEGSSQRSFLTGRAKAVSTTICKYLESLKNVFAAMCLRSLQPIWKPGFTDISATIGDCKTKNVTDFVSRELPVSHNSLSPRQPFEPKATITRCDLSSRFFFINATLLCEFESDKI